MKKHVLLFGALISFCSFCIGQGPATLNLYKGDTLNGFDLPACKAEAIRRHYDDADMLLFVAKQEIEFVRNKYHLQPARTARLKSLPVNGKLTSSCNNVDFENGDFSGWIGGYGYNTNSSGPLTIAANGIFNGATNAPLGGCTYHNLMSNAGGTDFYSHQPVNDPNGGAFSVRLGGDWLNVCDTAYYLIVRNNFGFVYPPCLSGLADGKGDTYAGGELLQQTFRVTASNSLFTYNYSVVMDKINHTNGEQPYFRTEVLDSLNNPINCLQYYVESINGAIPPGFVTSTVRDANVHNLYMSNGFGNVATDTVYYCPWTSNSLNLANYMNQKVTVRFTVAGCTLGAHFCYAYIDASCGSAHISSSGANNCFGQNDTLSAPPVKGGTYQWMTLPSGTAGIVGSSTGQTIVVNAPGHYQVTVTMPGGNGCSYTLDTTITFGGNPSLTAAPTSPTCKGGNDGSATVTTTGTGPFTYTWSPGPVGGQGTTTATGLTAGTYTVLVKSPGGCTNTTTVTVVNPAGITASITPTSAACYGQSNGTATANASGGTGALTYSWSPAGGTVATATGLAAGTYTCLVTDSKGCNITSVVTVGQPTVLTASGFHTNIDCSGAQDGSAGVNTTGGTPAYSYAWSPVGGAAATATGLSPGNYTCAITDGNGCQTSSVISISEPLPIQVTQSLIQQVKCFGGTGADTLGVTGGTPAYTYAWTPSGSTGSIATGLVPGTNYTCVITDGNGCKDTVHTQFTQPPAISATPVTQQATCTASNGSIAITPAGGTAPYTYSWAPSGGTNATVSNLPSGAYTCLIVDANGCTHTTTAVVGTGNSGLHAGFSMTPLGGMSPLTVVTTDHSAPNPTSWSWNFSNGNTATSQNSGTTFTLPGSYTVTETVTDMYGCTSDTTIVIDVKPPNSSLTPPNFFTPNGDGNNDGYYVKYENLKTFDLRIYDRWGVVMAHETDPSEPWDGRTTSGAAASDGTYFYVIVATGLDSKAYNLTGYLQLIR